MLVGMVFPQGGKAFFIPVAALAEMVQHHFRAAHAAGPPAGLLDGLELGKDVQAVFGFGVVKVCMVKIGGVLVVALALHGVGAAVGIVGAVFHLHFAAVISCGGSGPQQPSGCAADEQGCRKGSCRGDVDFFHTVPHFSVCVLSGGNHPKAMSRMIATDRNAIAPPRMGISRSRDMVRRIFLFLASSSSFFNRR